MTCDRHRNSYFINLETANEIVIILVIIILYCSLCRQYIEGMSFTAGNNVIIFLRLRMTKLLVLHTG